MSSCRLTFCKRSIGQPKGITTQRLHTKDIRPYCVPYKDTAHISELPIKGRQNEISLKRRLQRKFKGQYKNIVGQMCMVVDYARSVYTRVSNNGIAHSFFIPCTNKTLAAWFGLELHTIWAAQLINKRLWDLMELGILIAADNGVWHSPFEDEPSARKYFLDDEYAKSLFRIAKKEGILPECRWILTPVSAEQGKKAVQNAERHAKKSKTFAKFLSKLRDNCISGKNVMVYRRTYGKGMGLTTKEFWHLVNGLYRESSPWYNDLEKDLAELNALDDNQGAWAYNGDMNIKVTNNNYISGMSFRVNTRLCNMKSRTNRGIKKGSERDRELVKDLGADYITYDFHASILTLTKALHLGHWSASDIDIYDRLYTMTYGYTFPKETLRKSFKKEILSSYMPLSLDQAVNYALHREVSALTETLADVVYGDKLFTPHSKLGRNKLMKKAMGRFCEDGERIELGTTIAKNLGNLMGPGRDAFRRNAREHISRIHQAIVEYVGSPFGSAIFEFESCLVTKLCLELRKMLGCKVRNVFDAVYIPRTSNCDSEQTLKNLVETELMPKIFDKFYTKWRCAINRRIDIANERLERWPAYRCYREAI